MEKKNWVIILGWFGFALAAMYFLANSQMGADRDPNYKHMSQQIAVGSAGVIVLGYLLQRTKDKLGVGKGRCRTCGKQIPKNEVYCYNHGLKQIWDAQDSTRDKFGKR